MLFSSLSFLLFFFPLLIVSYNLGSSIKYKNFILFIFSLIFYAWGEPIYVALMIFSIFINYIHAIAICNLNDKGNTLGAKVAFISSNTINIGLLIFFKYTDFIIVNINYLFSTSINELGILLPIGISFYTFQIMSYTIDVYRGKVGVQRNFITLGTYIVLFPQLIAGPIVRYETIESELKKRSVSLDDVYSGISRFIIGLGKKVIIANQTAVIADKIFNLNSANMGLELAWIGIIAYTIQIYYDFSGYSDMAIGLGRIFGFTFLENFEYPYISNSVTEFWRRWHISLGSWFRDYVYIPLGGNRVNRTKWIYNIFLVWFLTGLWHGASWNFVTWGLYYGIILIIEKKIFSIVKISIPRFFRRIYTLGLIMIGWVIFRTDTLYNSINYILTLFGFYGHSTLNTFYNLSITSFIIFIILGIIGSTPLMKNMFNRYRSNIIIDILYDVYLILLFYCCLLFLINNSFNPFIYFRF